MHWSCCKSPFPPTSRRAPSCRAPSETRAGKLGRGCRLFAVQAPLQSQTLGRLRTAPAFSLAEPEPLAHGQSRVLTKGLRPRPLPRPRHRWESHCRLGAFPLPRRPCPSGAQPWHAEPGPLRKVASQDFRTRLRQLFFPQPRSPGSGTRFTGRKPRPATPVRLIGRRRGLRRAGGRLAVAVAVAEGRSGEAGGAVPADLRGEGSLSAVRSVRRVLVAMAALGGVAGLGG